VNREVFVAGDRSVAQSTSNNNAGWVLYDGRCGFCSAGARRTAGILKSLGFDLLPLQTPWVVQRLGASATLMAQEMALLTREGRVVGGVDAYVYVAEQFWWGRPFAWLARRRPVDRVLRWTYRWIAAHRQQISAACRLRPDLPPEQEVSDDPRPLH
jgi:predicted DCC family thiol-disulfide oxidoreductase YuxK